MGKKKQIPAKRRITPGYVFFYIIFSEDTWRILTGIVASVIFTPLIATTRPLDTSGKVIVGLMIVAIGWWAAGVPAQKFTAYLRSLVRTKYNNR